MKFWRSRGAPAPASEAAPPGVGFSELFAEAPASREAPPEPLTEAPAPPVRPEGIALAAAPGAAEAQNEAQIDAWAMAQTAPWRLAPVDDTAAKLAWKALNETSPSIFLYRFTPGEVALLPKAGTLASGEAALLRPRLYLAFFRSLLPLLPPDFQVTLALEAGDRMGRVVSVPVFCFQKRAGERHILLPDIDFLVHDFYRDPDLRDPLAYRDKAVRAVFAGSTTGGMITPEIARACALPRLRAARFFEQHERVEFLLPQIVQTTDEEARAVLARLPACQAPGLSWQEQFQRRFLLSMDGNGATCSRVAVALQSASVLLKYESDHVLFYFAGLQPWLHYLPVVSDADVDAILGMEDETPGLFEPVSRAASAFAGAYLTRAAVSRYTVRLLLNYRSAVSQTVAPARLAPPAGRAVLLLAHIENKGDTPAGSDGWAGTPGSGLGVEGFSLSLPRSSWTRRIAYRALAADGSAGERVEGGLYCGTRSRNQKLHGYVVEALPGEGDVPRILCEASFADGTRLGPAPAGTPCRAASGAALEALRVTLVPG